MTRALKSMVLCLLLASSAYAGDAWDGPEGRAARDAYNDGRFKEAAAALLTLAQRHPTEAVLYSGLARARVRAGDDRGAVLAYRVFLALSPDHPDREKLEAELTLAEKRVGAPVPDDALRGAAAALAVAQVAAESGRFVGPDGAFPALEKALKAGYLGADLAEVRGVIETAVLKHAEAQIQAWWAAETRLDAVVAAEARGGLEALSRLRTLNGVERERLEGLKGLEALGRGEVDAALRALGEVAPGDFRLRFAQAVGLVRAGRLEEASAVLDTLAQRPEVDPRIHLLRGWVLAERDAPDAIEALKQAIFAQE